MKMNDLYPKMNRIDCIEKEIPIKYSEINLINSSITGSVIKLKWSKKRNSVEIINATKNEITIYSDTEKIYEIRKIPSVILEDGSNVELREVNSIKLNLFEHAIIFQKEENGERKWIRIPIFLS